MLVTIYERAKVKPDFLLVLNSDHGMAVGGTVWPYFTTSEIGVTELEFKVVQGHRKWVM